MGFNNLLGLVAVLLISCSNSSNSAGKLGAAGLDASGAACSLTAATYPWGSAPTLCAGDTNCSVVDPQGNSSMGPRDIATFTGCCSLCQASPMVAYCQSSSDCESQQIVPTTQPSNCTDTTSDPNNCGGCGIVCSAGQTCCSGACVDLSSDVKNCGSCGNNCICTGSGCGSNYDTGTACASGSCTNPPGGSPF